MMTRRKGMAVKRIPYSKKPFAQLFRAKNRVAMNREFREHFEMACKEGRVTFYPTLGMAAIGTTYIVQASQSGAGVWGERVK